MVFNATFNNISVLSDHYRIYLILNTSKFYNVYVYYIFISRFQFLWMTDTETINSIIMSFTSAPVMIVLDPDTHYFYMPPFSLEDITTKDLAAYLDNIKEGKEEVSLFYINHVPL